MVNDLESAVAAHRTRSEQLCVMLRERGVDVGAIQKVTAFFTAPDQEQGSLLASRLLREGFSEVRSAPTTALLERSGVALEGERPTSWSVQAVITTSLNQVTSDEVTKSLCVLALEYMTTYDGWGL